jgi:hypothetical protein
MSRWPTTLEIHAPVTATDDATRLHPGHVDAMVRWPRHIGPTAYLFMLVGRQQLLCDPGEIHTVDFEDLARHLGVTGKVLDNALGRLHRPSVLYYAPDPGIVLTDFLFPPRSIDRHLETELIT